MTTTPRFVLCGALLFASFAGLGCHSNGREEVTRETEAEVNSRRVRPAALIEFSDQAAQRVAQEISEIPEIRNVPGRVTILVGDINNKTGIVSSDDFELMRSRLRNNLLQSKYVKDKLKFVERRARMSAIRERELVGPDQGNGEPANYDAQTTFALNGDFYRLARNGTDLYYMEFQLVHFGSNEIVFSDRYEMKQFKVND
ncbi:MAG: penicillin-binding protein activator LpoB [Planctomycetes bacterium]|nr:penicillin-binding protein activator LpoB [Planctomycetota bacterium]